MALGISVALPLCTPAPYHTLRYCVTPLALRVSGSALLLPFLPICPAYRMTKGGLPLEATSPKVTTLQEGVAATISPMVVLCCTHLGAGLGIGLRCIVPSKCALTEGLGNVESPRQDL